MARKKANAARRSWGSIRQLPNKSARWQASYVGPDCVRHYAPRTYTAKMDAEGWLVDERRLVELNVWTPPARREAERLAGSLTVADYARTWVEERPLKPRTKAGYESLLERRVEGSLIGAVPLRNLTPQAVRAWHAAMDKDKPTARAYQILHAVCATAVTDGLLPANPCNITKAMAAATKRQATILEPGQVAALADAIEPKRLRAMVLVMAWCAPRWGEAIELRRKDVSADCSVLTIARGATHRNGECHVDTPKSGKGRKVVVPPHIRDDLRAHLDENVAKGPDALLFPAAMGGCHLNDRVFRDYFVDAQEAIDVEGVRVHDLRHFSGTQAARVGNLVETMGRLGHSTVRASLIYQQIASGRDAEVAEALSGLANGGNTPRSV
ncbi:MULTISPECIES: tyrosine-type recombinase/integrase [Mycobacterium]|uniref:Prophage phiRv2 integrase n=1 Tax=Mycobacterium kiyosense TaxID=2871094 RepID=A0A9P3Q7B5_9MYCO|nr:MULTISPECIES: site-specific integrase [Mycobacterium]BDB43856.1 putative prophage phiRv2 integrase [Mycobacterium kiyosense]BDE15412.1 putative prophage phiRv2 integrase [Mycobacterium sp. 20KCMC460]GLB82700.1 putative prophage phiRv2 integrase [Mycobacterium kiyosense]GLB90163.1 putative prophage phiRv2 integrase [Mycobacterium kiyosense]GLB95752.1 putative prophage phiRv2 integrase [Mycobacterium kiyosense]